MTDEKNTKKLWTVLASLVLAVAVIIVLDTLPVADPLKNVTDAVTADDTVWQNDTENDTAAPPETTAVPEHTAEADVLESTPAADTVPVSTAEESVADTEAPPPPEDDGSVTLSFLGACAPGSPLGISAYGSLNATAKEQGADYFFARLAEVLAKDDLTVAANACVFGESGGTDSLYCSAPADAADIYKSGSVEFVSLTAPLEHFTDDTRRTTADALQSRDIQCASSGEITYFTLKDMTVAVLSTTLLKNGSTTADLAALKEAREKADYTVVYFWGGEKDSHTPEEWLTRVLRTYADAGASLLVGCGNNALRPIEQYGSATIAYSLGSLLDGSGLTTDMTSAILSLTLTREDDGTIDAAYTMLPCYAYDKQWQPCFVTDEKEAAQVSAFLNGSASAPTLS